MKYIKKMALPSLFVLPFIVGVIGYLFEGEALLDAAYYSFTLYAVNPVYEDKNLLIEIARWLAPAVLASGLLVFIKELGQRIRDFFVSLGRDSFTIYGDSEEVPAFKNAVGKAVISKDMSVRDTDNHIIMFKDEAQSFRFFEKNRERLEGKTVFIKSDSIEMFKNDSDSFRILNLKEMVARSYWREHNLMKYFLAGQQEIQVAFIGFDGIARKLLDYALLNNIYSLGQKITYRVWGDSKLYEGVHPKLKLMNGDDLVFHGEKWQEDVGIISRCDRIIFSDVTDISDLFMLADKCRESEIHCYNLDKSMLDAFNNPSILSFGCSEDVLTKESIFLKDVYYSAKRLNFHYECLYGGAKEEDGEKAMEECWKKLDSFLKTSNISSADYHLMRRIITEKADLTDAELAEMEHIRWCRVHFLNHWKEGSNAQGEKDKKKRLHPCLVPFEQLKQIDKDKDYESVKILSEVLK